MSRLVLMECGRHHEGMFGLILIALIVVAAPLAYAIGAESRIDDVARRRRFNG
jgi:hypothetical protein